jgi:hypothetical protein
MLRRVHFEIKLTSRPVLPAQHINRRRKPKHNIQNTGDPDELLCERARHPHVAIAKDDGNSKAKDEQNDGVGVEAEVISM